MKFLSRAILVSFTTTHSRWRWNSHCFCLSSFVHQQRYRHPAHRSSVAARKQRRHQAGAPPSVSLSDHRHLNCVAGGDARISNTCFIIDEDCGQLHNTTVIDNDNNNIVSSIPWIRKESLDSSDDEQPQFTHALSIVPYELLSDGDDSDVLIQNYALAIQSIDDAGSKPRSRRTAQRKPQRRRPKPARMDPFYIDFCPPDGSRLGRRQSEGAKNSDLLIKAVAPRKHRSQSKDDTGADDGAIVYDLTAGLGQDSLLLATAGAKRVHMVERNPIVAMLLDDALRRLRMVAKCQQQLATTDSPALDDSASAATELAKKLTLVHGDGRTIISNATDCDIVYLDPMFPSRTKSAAVKKNMQLLHGLLDTQRSMRTTTSIPDDDTAARCREETELLEAAYQAAKDRVVVKRPIKAPTLGESNLATAAGEEGVEGPPLRKPSHRVLGSVNRFDVYVKPR